MPLRPELTAKNSKVLILGSGGLSIGQAGEFDYSGTQAVKALLEEGLEVILVNPNIATVQTNPQVGLKIYLYPVEASWVERVIAQEKPDALMAGFGGQTALNCALELDQKGILEKYGVVNLGTAVESLRASEDRQLFADKMHELRLPVPSSRSATNLESALEAGEALGFPVILRAAYTLGGLGGGFAHSREQLRDLVEAALSISPQVLIEKSLQGWREIEYEVMRDSAGNAITICNMENFDPLGIHTGDSIVVAPSQTLSDGEFQLLRNAALTIAGALKIIGECNVQFALSPHSNEFFIIEVNARLSRSSALASKATGYPIAAIAAKVVLGYSLLELKNPVTGVTSAFYEPALDYITVKMPRWESRKFSEVSRVLGSAMKSVGEVMAIGRSFPEALQKAVRMVTENSLGLSAAQPIESVENLRSELRNPTDQRIFKIAEAFRQGMALADIYELTFVDKWFLAQVKFIVQMENEISEQASNQIAIEGNSSLNFLVENTLRGLDREHLRQWKNAGFGDEQIVGIWSHRLKAKIRGSDLQEASLILRRQRLSLGVKPVVKKIDTTAGEFPSRSNYLYLTYHGDIDDERSLEKGRPSAIVIGGGPYSVGSSVEFDWCAVSCSERLKQHGWRSIVVNCNPETVSTDYNSSDSLYFEEITLERLLDIKALEDVTGVVCSMGGQTPNRLVNALEKFGFEILGHSSKTVHMAESRSDFSEVLDKLDLDQPRCGTLLPNPAWELYEGRLL